MPAPRTRRHAYLTRNKGVVKQDKADGQGESRQTKVQVNIVKSPLTIKRAIPLSLDKVGPIWGQVVLDGLLSTLLRHFSFEKHVESAQPSLSRDPGHSGLAVQLESDDFWTCGEVCIDEGIQHRPEHFRFASSKGRSNGRSYR